MQRCLHFIRHKSLSYFYLTYVNTRIVSLYSNGVSKKVN